MKIGVTLLLCALASAQAQALPDGQEGILSCYPIGSDVAVAKEMVRYVAAADLGVGEETVFGREAVLDDESGKETSIQTINSDTIMSPVALSQIVVLQEGQVGTNYCVRAARR